jgi:hypothetical protein
MTEARMRLVKSRFSVDFGFSPTPIRAGSAGDRASGRGFGRENGAHARRRPSPKVGDDGAR